ncbi:hypothetical protein NM208_g8941 [Fusarium decemcellulare]|uniref:Uncharacterized protein n=1 Tax=Fusarium decemcellulare TaxID=57161 RepID=A0ACC1S3J1_9HYPO|nr:hypothetical protein NM208_g8941 [Fusarium decemcellulare]
MEPQTQISDGIPDDEISYHSRDQEILRNNGMIYLGPYRAFKEVPSDVKRLAENMTFHFRVSYSDATGEDEYMKIFLSRYQLEESVTPAMIKEYWKTLLGAIPRYPPLRCSDSKAIYRKWMPRVPGMETFGDPEPTLLYGYRLRQFGEPKIRGLKALSQGGVNNDSLFYPFLAVAVQDDNSNMKGSLWAATDTCLASSSVCVTLAQKLEQELKAGGADYFSTIDNIAFSVAMNGTVARLYVTFVTENGTCAMYNARSFLLQNPYHHVEFRTTMLHILHWGQRRLNTIVCQLRSMVLEDISW